MERIYFDPQKVIDPQRTEAYLKDLWNKDYAQGLYFSAFHELNQDLYVPIKIDDQVYHAHHGLFDGMSLLEKLDKMENLNLELNVNSPFNPPRGMMAWVKSVKAAASSKPVEALEYRHQRDQGFGPEHFRCFHLSFKESELPDTSLSYFLQKSSQFFTKKLTKNQTTRWMVPVNVRGQVTPPKKGDIQASYVGLNIDLDDNPKSVGQKVKQALKSGEYWGAWMIAQLGLKLGKKAIMKGTISALNDPKSRWLGCFSSLGNIGDQVTKKLSIMLPVRYHRPLGVVHYRYNHAHHILVTFHDSLCVSDENLEDLEAELYKAIKD